MNRSNGGQRALWYLVTAALLLSVSSRKAVATMWLAMMVSGMDVYINVWMGVNV